mmetsp:Transcript_16936/g.51375  ORF Transcript_16936/g.51375 Transcript_16936/m.51375 type:complete len:274 (+) Transcript_16936:56-877(+)
MYKGGKRDYDVTRRPRGLNSRGRWLLLTTDSREVRSEKNRRRTSCGEGGLSPTDRPTDQPTNRKSPQQGRRRSLWLLLIQLGEELVAEAGEAHAGGDAEGAPADHEARLGVAGLGVEAVAGGEVGPEVGEAGGDGGRRGVEGVVGELLVAGVVEGSAADGGDAGGGGVREKTLPVRQRGAGGIAEEPEPRLSSQRRKSGAEGHVPRDRRRKAREERGNAAAPPRRHCCAVHAAAVVPVDFGGIATPPAHVFHGRERREQQRVHEPGEISREET